MTQLAAEFEALGVDLIVTEQALDTTTPSGRLLFAVLAGISEFELDMVRERTRSGLQAAKRRGKRLGRPRVYVATAKARTLLDRGMSLTAVARELGVARGTLSKSLVARKPLRQDPANLARSLGPENP